MAPIVYSSKPAPICEDYLIWSVSKICSYVGVWIVKSWVWSRLCGRVKGTAAAGSGSASWQWQTAAANMGTWTHESKWDSNNVSKRCRCHRVAAQMSQPSLSVHLERKKKEGEMQNETAPQSSEGEMNCRLFIVFFAVMAHLLHLLWFHWGTIFRRVQCLMWRLNEHQSTDEILS